jgi:hypothetical protein
VGWGSEFGNICSYEGGGVNGGHVQVRGSGGGALMGCQVGRRGS